MQVSYIVSTRVMILAKDRNTYDLHNAEEIMIMQMREQRESQKTSREGGFTETASDPEITET